MSWNTCLIIQGLHNLPYKFPDFSLNFPWLMIKRRVFLDLSLNLSCNQTFFKINILCIVHYRKMATKSYSFLLKLSIASRKIVQILLILLLRKHEKSDSSWFFFQDLRRSWILKKFIEHYKFFVINSFGYSILLLKHKQKF